MAPGSALHSASMSALGTASPTFLNTFLLRVCQLYIFCANELADG